MTRASDTRPVRRIVASQPTQYGTLDEYTIEVSLRSLVMRPIRTRRGGKSEVTIPWGALYTRAIVAKVDAEKRARESARKRGRR